MALSVREFDPEWNLERPGAKGEDEYWVRLELRDGDGAVVGEVGDYSSLDLTWSSLADDVEASSFTLPGTSSWANLVMQANRRIILVRIEVYRANNQIKLWTGRIDRSIRSKEGPQTSITVELISDKAWLKYIVAWSAPFAPLATQAPREEIKYGKAITSMKKFISDNLLRIESGLGAASMLIQSNQWDSPSNWSNAQQRMWPVSVTAINEPEDTSPTVALIARMTPIAELISDVCKDYHLLPTVQYLIPGRDPIPADSYMFKPGILIDIKDKDLTRSRGTPGSWLSGLGKDALAFIRGAFGRYDVPPEPEMASLQGRMKFLGNRTEDPWVIFRDSDEHWSQMEFASYAPTASRSISGGKSQEFLNEGITLIANFLISTALAAVGLGFLSGLGNLLTGTLEDVLFAYQDANDHNMRSTLGDYTFFEESLGQGTTAYSFDAVQQLREARYGSIGYETATFTGGVSAFRPFRVFEDFDLLDPVAWEDSAQDRLIPERVKQISMFDSREDGVQFEVRLGEQDRPEEPWTIQQRRNDMFAQAINTALTI